MNIKTNNILIRCKNGKYRSKPDDNKEQRLKIFKHLNLLIKLKRQAIICIGYHSWHKLINICDEVLELPLIKDSDIKLFLSYKSLAYDREINICDASNVGNGIWYNGFKITKERANEIRNNYFEGKSLDTKRKKQKIKKQREKKTTIKNKIYEYFDHVGVDKAVAWKCIKIAKKVKSSSKFNGLQMQFYQGLYKKERGKENEQTKMD